MKYEIEILELTVYAAAGDRQAIDFAAVRKLAHELPEVEDSTMHGAPSLKVRGKLLTCMAVHKSAEPGSLA